MAKKKAPRPAPAGMPGMEGPPEAGDVIGLWNWKRKESSETGLRTYIREVRARVDMSIPPRIPKEYQATTQVTMTPFMRDMVQRVAASLVKDPPIPQAEPRDETVNAKRAADITSRWLKATYHLLDKERNTDTPYESAKMLVRDSESVLKVVHRPDAWANFPARGGQEEEGDGENDVGDGETADSYLERTRKFKQSRGVRLPMAMRMVDRLEMYFEDGEYGDRWAVEYGEYPLPYLSDYTQGMHYDQTSKKWVNPRTKLGGKPYPYGEYASGTGGFNYALSSGSAGRTKKWEYWDANYWAVVIDGVMAPGFPRDNPYKPWIPYFRAIGEPVLYSLRYLQPNLDSLLTMKQNWAYLSAFPVPVLESVATGQQFPLDGLPTGDNGVKPKFTWHPGKLNVPPSGFKFSFMEPPPSGATLDSLINIYRELIDIAGISSIFRGQSPGSRSPGYAVNQLMAAANLTYRMLGEALKRQFEGSAEFMLHLVSDVIKDTVYVLADEAA